MTAVCFTPISLAPSQCHHAPCIGWMLIHSMFQLFYISRPRFDSDYDSSSSLLSFNVKTMSYYIYVLIYEGRSESSKNCLIIHIIFIVKQKEVHPFQLQHILYKCCENQDDALRHNKNM